jgi:erythromycin esterase-like protein
MEIETIVTELGVEKRCVKCGEFWPAEPEFFQRNRDNPDGLDNYCKDCRQQARIKTQQTFNEKRAAARRERVRTKKRLSTTIVRQGEI